MIFATGMNRSGGAPLILKMKARTWKRIMTERIMLVTFEIKAVVLLIHPSIVDRDF